MCCIDFIAHGHAAGVETVDIRARDVRIGPKDLTDLEVIVTDAAIQCCDHTVVVADESVIASIRVDSQSCVDRFVVVDTLKRVGQSVFALWLCLSLQQCQKVSPQQEQIVACRSVDQQTIGPVIGRPAIVDGNAFATTTV